MIFPRKIFISSVFANKNSVMPRLSAIIRPLADLIGRSSKGGNSSENKVLQLVFRNHSVTFARKLEYFDKKSSVTPLHPANY